MDSKSLSNLLFTCLKNNRKIDIVFIIFGLKYIYKLIKKIAHIGIVFLLLISTSGITLYKHYCSGSLISESVIIPAKNCCCNHCKACHNETTLFKIIDNFEVSGTETNFTIEVKKILDPITFSFLLFDRILVQHTSNNLFYKVKTCGNLRSPIENPTAFLQVFRL
jgi:hypothetical protein